jgi:hypothetical protein
MLTGLLQMILAKDIDKKIHRSRHVGKGMELPGHLWQAIYLPGNSMCLAVWKLLNPVLLRFSEGFII